MRLFLALIPPPGVRREFAAAATVVRRGHGRPVTAADLHVTLAFVGHVEAAGREACERAAARVCAVPFTLDFDRCGAFERARVAWLAPALVPTALTALVTDLRAALHAEAVPHDLRPFRCHLTIARDVRAFPRPPAVPCVRWPVTDFALVASISGSAGVRYERRAKWPLRPAGRDETAPPPVQ